MQITTLHVEYVIHNVPSVRTSKKVLDMGLTSRSIQVLVWWSPVVRLRALQTIPILRTCSISIINYKLYFIIY